MEHGRRRPGRRVGSGCRWCTELRQSGRSSDAGARNRRSAGPGVVDSIVAAVPPNRTDEAKLVVGDEVIVAGGSGPHGSRSDSRWRRRDTDFVLVHDAAGALTPRSLARVVQALESGHPAVVPVAANRHLSRRWTPTAVLTAGTARCARHPGRPGPLRRTSGWRRRPTPPPWSR